MAIPRSKWTWRKPSPTPDRTPKTRVFVHHTVTSGRRRTRRQEQLHMRELERMHLDRGFVCIGYHFVLFPSGRLYEGRPVWAIPAAQGGDNSGTIAIAYVSNTDVERVTLRAKARLVTAVLHAKGNHPVQGVGGHRDANTTEGTACPGKHLYAFIPRLAKLTRLVRLHH